MNNDQANETLRQIGGMNLLAISGGRALVNGDGALVLKVGRGYSVEIDLTASDDYTVRRVYQRGAKKWVKGEVERVYCDEIGEIAYRASCFVNVAFGEHDPCA